MNGADAKVKSIMDEAGFPDGMRVIFTGTVRIKARRYRWMRIRDRAWRLFGRKQRVYTVAELISCESDREFG